MFFISQLIQKIWRSFKGIRVPRPLKTLTPLQYLKHLKDPTKTSKLKIIAKHTFTLFNFVNIVLALMVAFVGSYKNMLFIVIAIANTLISIVNEIRAKKIVDELKLISEKSPKIIGEDGKTYEVQPNEVKKGDIVVLGLGDQVLFDSVVIEGAVEVNAANITGEQEIERKEPHETLRSGSFIVSGICKAKVAATLADSAIAKLEQSAHEIKTADSKLFTLMNKIVRYISYALIPIGALLLWSRFRVPDTTTEVAITSTVAALINMIPEGLILLTSSVLALATIRLARKKVLVQDLYAIETLARVDTICLDKTGTLTTGRMKVTDLIPTSDGGLPESLQRTLYAAKLTTDPAERTLRMAKSSTDATKQALRTEKTATDPAKNALVNALELILGHLPADNATSQALHEKFARGALKRVSGPKTGVEGGASGYELIPFSSDRKFSGIKNDREEFLIGALEFVAKDSQVIKQGKAMMKNLSPSTRVLAVIYRDCQKNQDTLLGLVLLEDEIRKNAREIIQYFYDNNVDVRIISGDNLATVASIAKTVGAKGLKGIDLSTKNQHDYAKLVQEYQIFTRVTPGQKKEIIAALKREGRTVAMTGDGVNDILAMKEADASIAIGEGSDAARRSAKIVLIDSGFEAVPAIIAEGRQTINNLERSTSLFLTKTVYASLLAVVFVFLPYEYPFSPIEMSLLNFLCIGFPGLLLALEKNTARIKDQFIRNIKRYSIPTGLIIAAAIILLAVIYGLKNNIGLWEWSRDQLLLISATIVFAINFILLYRISRPLNKFRASLLALILAAFLVVILTPLGAKIFEFAPLMSKNQLVHFLHEFRTNLSINPNKKM